MSTTARPLVALLFSAAFLLMAAFCFGAVEQPRPNIIFILADDLGWAELGCYGNRFNETPHLDRLAEAGMLFTHAYAAAPVCSPTRAAFLTGQSPARVGITDYLEADDARYLSPDRPTLSRILKSAGYVTGLIGKWHLMGDYGKRRGDPRLHGFDEVICSETRYIGGGDYFGPYDFMPQVQPRSADEYLTDRLTEEAVDFVRRHRDRPFFLYLSHYAVHALLAGKPALVAHFKNKPDAGVNRNNPVLAAMLTSIDEGVGALMSELAALGLADRTIVIFTSDNGGEHKVTSNAPLRGAKSQLYEGGLRVPLIVYDPGTAAAGARCDVPAITMDFYPTLLERVGLTVPAGHSVDGCSLVPLLRQEDTWERDSLFWHYPRKRPHFLGGRSSGAIRFGGFNLIEFFDTGRYELYDLKGDPGEQVDLSEDKPALVKELRNRLAQWRVSVGARVPVRTSPAPAGLPR